MRDAFGLSGYQLALTAAAAAVTAGWLLATAVIGFARRPREPPVGPATLDVGPEPPALANMLVNDFRVTPDAVPATLLDFAARGIVEIERVDVEVYQVRLRPADPAALSEYERRVLDLLGKRESGGVVPAQALTTGPSAESKRWWRRFRGEVVADAQGRGLSRDVWDNRTIRALGVAAAVPAPLVGLAYGFDPAVVYVVGAAAVLGGLKSRRRQRETPAGLAAASRWLGVRAELERDEVFPTQPPIAVALWKRLLAYGAALGLAAGAIRPIPMGAESETRAWSSYGGKWRQVKIRYPHLLPLGWGSSPPAALLRSLAIGVMAAFPLFVLLSAVELGELRDRGGLEAAIVSTVLLLLLGIVLVAARLALRAIADLWSTRELSGEILRLRVYGSEERRRAYLALDDGSSSTVRAWRVRPQLVAPFHQHQLVVASVTPRLGFVRSLQALPAAATPSPPAHATVEPA